MRVTLALGHLRAVVQFLCHAVGLVGDTLLPEL
jgi:hypothetical protein